MHVAPGRHDEIGALAALSSLEVLDSGPEPELDALVRIASTVCGVPISLISLVDAERQWFKANIGLPGVSETPRDVAFCAHAVLQDGLFEVPDATQDPRFADNPLVSGAPDIRFYAGAPLRLSSGHRVGTLCVIDRRPRWLDPTQRDVLRQLAVAAAQILEGRHAIRQVERANAEAAAAALVLRHSADAVIGLSIGAHVKQWNGAAERMFGYAPQEIVGQPMALLVPPQDHGARDSVFGRLTHDGDSESYEAVLVHRNGTPIDVAITLVPEFDAAGQRTGCTKFVRDISKRRRAERALLESERSLRFEVTERERVNGLLMRSTASMQEAQRLGRIGSWEWRIDPDITTWSDELYRILGQDPRCPPPSYAEHAMVYLPASWALLQAAVEQALRTGERYAMDLEFQRPDGGRGWVHARGEAMRNIRGDIIGLRGTAQDVTDARRLSAELARQNELLRVTLQSIGDAVITTDAEGRVTWLNPVAERMTGWPSAEASGRPLTQVFNIVDAETRQPSTNPVAACLAQDAVVGLAQHTLLVSRDGAEFGIEDSAAPIRSDRGDMLGVVLVFHDVTEQRRLSGEMSFRATHDALTGLVNRAEFETRLSRTLDKSHQDRSEHAVLYIDLDQFKLVNDACGHAVGDQLLQQVSRLLADAVRARDTLARLGGDEFAVILEHCTSEQAQRVAQQVCDRMDDFRFVHDGRRFRIGTSIGLVPLDSRWASTAAILQAADTSCYAAKEAGRNRVHAWFDTDGAIRARHGEMQWASRLETALDEGRFVLFAQRIEPLHGKAGGLHAEVLLRMLDDDGALVPPGAFLPAAERFHLASRIDRWVLRRAVEWMKAVPAIDKIENLSVNLSGQSIGDRSFHRWALELLGDAGAAVCTRLCLEITETAAVTSFADATVFIERVRAAGVKVALDDFGAGASSFGYLKTLPVDYLKIDGQFIRNLITDPLDEAAVRCFADVAKVMGIETVAEFVENAEVMQRLRAIRIDHAQGFLLHRPEPLDALLASSTAVPG
ncbi:EAL domain-containing protein [Ideonella sp. A 288]|uniref:EAL domain-containing protein n=1 Tax=Ideonella sp. A 288 TaxID=1962181 RepID=UPI000B4B65A4|nr:EAL domain-containing protein [Ideonella sp. A 288]